MNVKAKRVSFYCNTISGSQTIYYLRTEF